MRSESPAARLLKLWGMGVRRPMWKEPGSRVKTVPTPGHPEEWRHKHHRLPLLPSSDLRMPPSMLGTVWLMLPVLGILLAILAGQYPMVVMVWSRCEEQREDGYPA